MKPKLFHKFLLFVLPCLVLSVFVTSGILSWTSYRFFGRNISSNYKNILKASAGEIRQYVQSALKDLEGLAVVLSATKVDPFRQEMALIAFQETAPYFDRISLVALDGQVLATTKLIGNDADDLHRDKTFEKAASGQSAISEVMTTEQNVPYAHIAVPVRHLRDVSAVIRGRLNLKSVWDVLEGIRIGETGQVYLMDFSGRSIGHREMDKVVNGAPMVGPEILRKLLASGGLPVEWRDETKDGKNYCLGLIIPELNWIIVLTQDKSETHSYVHQNMRWSVLLTVLVCMAAAFAGWFTIKRILRPIHTLHSHVQRIGLGDLDQRAPVESRDEIGELGAAFNKMADSLKMFIKQQVETAKELAHSRNLATLGAASSKVTHEVGNLLNNVEIILFRLKREPLSSTVVESIDRLELEIGRINRFIENLLQFAKKPPLRLQETNMKVIVQEVIAVYGSEAERRGIRLELDWPSDLPPVCLDASLMYQVLNNLIKNSLETTTDPSLIQVTGSIEGDYLRVTIKDDGAGIEAHIIDQIFEPFFSTKNDKGTGLGLAICKTIMEAHRGGIECESKAGEHTSFILRLPLK